MMFVIRETVQDLLHNLQILPISNSNWHKFDVHLQSDSTKQQYIDTKKKINSFVPKGTCGIYIIAKNEKILYIGESENNIHNRLSRHMDKIYTRTDSRADFFKLKEHQGDLSIYYRPLPLNLMNERKSIEELLTLALEPEYKKWNVQVNMDHLVELFDAADFSMQYTNNVYSTHPVNGKSQEKCNKDNMPERIQKHAPTARQYWGKFLELHTHDSKDGILAVNVGADDPTHLESEEAIEFALNIAKRKGLFIFLKIEDDIRIYGQNCLTERRFYFQRQLPS